MRWLRQAYENQVSLQQRRIDRTAVSGREAVAASRRLRWSGMSLVGDLIPTGNGR